MVESEAQATDRRSHARRGGVRPRAAAGRHRAIHRTGRRSAASRSGTGGRPAKDEPLIAKVAALARSRSARGVRRSARSRRAQQRLKEDQRAKVEAECAAAGRRCRREESRQQPAVRHRSRRSSATQILSGEPRIDGRDTRTVRPIEIRTGVLPRTHGSALFTRGETQALVVATLGTDARRADHRRARGRVSRALHAPLQHASVRDRRNGPRRFAEAPRNRPRPAGQARVDRGAADAPRNSPTRCAWCRKSPNRTALRRWRRSAAAASR